MSELDPSPISSTHGSSRRRWQESQGQIATPQNEILSFLFWNIRGKDLSELVCHLAADTHADFVVLTETGQTPKDLLSQFKRNVSPDFYIPNAVPSSDRRFHCYCRNPQLDMSEVHSGMRTSVRVCNLGTARVLMTLLHGVDIRNNDGPTRQAVAQTLTTDLQMVAEKQGINKMIVLGDFNMNPFDPGMMLAEGFNAMMTRQCVKRGSRRHIGKDYDFYYNPMWGLFGDSADGPAGTIYDTSNQGPYGWSMLDQVLIHHSLVPLFHDVAILTKAGAVSLMDANGHPDEKHASDHFPILVRFHGEKL